MTDPTTAIRDAMGRLEASIDSNSHHTDRPMLMSLLETGRWMLEWMQEHDWQIAGAGYRIKGPIEDLARRYVQQVRETIG